MKYIIKRLPLSTGGLSCFTPALFFQRALFLLRPLRFALCEVL